MTDSLNNKELVLVGHDFAKALSSDTPIIDIAKMLSRLADRLDVTAAVLRETVKQRDALAVENTGMKNTLESIINPDSQPEYHDQGMGCGVEDRGYQRDGYSACYYGWESAMERVYSEVISDAIPETPATDAFLAEVRAQESKRVYESILDNPAVTDMESLVDWLEQNANDSVAFAANLRKGVQS